MKGPVGWFPDPEGGNGLRYFDGEEWTQIAPPPAAPAPAPAPPPVSVVVNNSNNVGTQPQTGGAWILLAAFLFNPWAWVLGVFLWVMCKPLVIGAVILAGVLAYGKYHQRQQAAIADVEKAKLSARADVENEYNANGDPRGTYGRHMPPLFGEDWK